MNRARHRVAEHQRRDLLGHGTGTHQTTNCKRRIGDVVGNLAFDIGCRVERGDHLPARKTQVGPLLLARLQGHRCELHVVHIAVVVEITKRNHDVRTPDERRFLGRQQIVERHWLLVI